MGKPTKTHIVKLNEFLSSVTEKTGVQKFASRSYSNPLAKHKKGFIEGANEIEEIYVARLESKAQDLEGLDPLKKVKPNVQTQYHKQNYGKLYSCSVSDQQVRRAFINKGGVGRLADQIIESMSTGYEYDEYVAMRDNLGFLVKDTPSKVKVEPVTDLKTAQAFIKAVKKDQKKMDKRSTKFATVESNSKKSDLVLYVLDDIMVETDVELFMNAFNMDKGEIDNMIQEVDSFPIEGVVAMLVDKDAVMVYDTLYNSEQMRNGKGMFTNHHLNVEKIISTSNMYNVSVYHTNTLEELNTKTDEFETAQAQSLLEIIE